VEEGKPRKNRDNQILTITSFFKLNLTKKKIKKITK